MKPAPFTYARPDSLDEALTLLQAAGEDVKLLAGGQSLVPLLNLRMASVDEIVDLNRLGELAYVKRENDTLCVGSMTRHRHIEVSAEVEAAQPLLTRAAAEVGHLAIRNRGTIGGSLVHADPAAEWPLVAVALDARFVLRSREAIRTVPAREFFVGPLMTVIEPQEILCEVRFPVAPAGVAWGFQELCRRPGDFAIAAVACQLTLADDGRCAAASLAVGGAHDTPLHVPEVASVLAGTRADDAEAIDRAAQHAADSVEPSSDVHGSAEYRRRMVKVLGVRALREAWDKTG